MGSAAAGRVIRWSPALEEAQFLAQIDKPATPDIQISPKAPDLRVRHVQKGGRDYYLLFNEGAGTLEFKLELSAKGSRLLLDPFRGPGRALADDGPIRLAGHTLHVLTPAQS